jgi:hypothetical protein
MTKKKKKEKLVANRRSGLFSENINDAKIFKPGLEGGDD